MFLMLFINSCTYILFYRSGKNGVPKKYYTLECLIFLLKNVHLPHLEYVGKAKVI